MRRSRAVPAALLVILLVLIAATIWVLQEGEAAPSPSPSPSPSPTLASPSLSPSPTPPAPTPTRAAADAWTEFRLRLVEAAGQIGDDLRDLESGLSAEDPEAVRAPAEAIGRLVEAERIWLVIHTPADCYAVAHAAADRMLEAFAAASAGAIAWLDARGLDRLLRLGDAVQLASRAQAAMSGFVPALEAVVCPG